MPEPLVSKVELRLADELEARGVRISRQVSVPAPGPRPFSIDIAIIDARVDIEVDGPHHDTPLQRRKDAYRDDWLRKQGWEVIRVPASAVDADADGTAATIARTLDRRGALSWRAWPAMMLRRAWRSRVLLLAAAVGLDIVAMRILQVGCVTIAEPSIALAAIAVLLSLRVTGLDHGQRRGGVRRRKPFGFLSDLAVLVLLFSVLLITAFWMLL